MRVRPRPLLLGAVLLCVGSGCQEDPAERTPAQPEVLQETPEALQETPAEFELRLAAERGLPVRLVPADFGTPGYVAPRMRCAAVLHDTENPGTELQLVQQHMRHDESRTADGTRTTTYAEGHYAVRPRPLYGLESDQLLRVNCARQAATGVVSPIEPD